MIFKPIYIDGLVNRKGVWSKITATIIFTNGDTATMLKRFYCDEATRAAQSSAFMKKFADGTKWTANPKEARNAGLKGLPKDNKHLDVYSSHFLFTKLHLLMNKCIIQKCLH